LRTVAQHDEPTIGPGIEVVGRIAREAAYRALAANTKRATYFRLRQRLVKQGRAATCLAATDKMRIALKVYAGGGERTLHAHPHEDHTFIVLHGKVRFFDRAGRSIVLAAHRGLLIPRGVHYRFDIVTRAPAVMLRIGAQYAHDENRKRPARTKKRVKVIFANRYFE